MQKMSINEIKQKLNTPEGAIKVFFIYYEQLKKQKYDITGKTILNIGTGELAGLDIMFLLFGARKVISIDLNFGKYLYPDITNQLSFYNELWQLLTKRGICANDGFFPGIIERLNGKVYIKKDRLTQIKANANNIPLKDQSIGFCFSNAVFEHIENPEHAIQEIERVLTINGNTMHRIDLRDHADFTKPYEFLKPGEPASGCNLWRSYQYEEAFNCGSLKIVEFDVFDIGKVTDGDKRLFKPAFAKLTCAELERLRFMVYAKKVNSE